MTEETMELTKWELMSVFEFLSLAISVHAPSDAMRAEFKVSQRAGATQPGSIEIACANIFTMHAVMRYVADALESLRKFRPYKLGDPVPSIQFVVDESLFEGAALSIENEGRADARLRD